ncbi:MAG: ABC transporter ATP-binding protein [Angelakisella sp.]|nr:ABC transporter ATP-binding protein [Angelakisella sp.]
MLKIQNLHVSYGGIQAVRDVSFEVPEGKIVTLIGANGAGKSTTLRSIIGLVPATGGSILYKGEELRGKTTAEIVAKGVTLVPEGRRVFPDLTVEENLRIGAYLRKDDLKSDLEWVYSLFPRLKERHWQAAGTLSGGEQQMLAVGRALMSRPKLVMMDEPSLGLAPIVVQQIFAIIRKINEEGVTVLLIEQNANMALHAADIGYVMETGSITRSGDGKTLLEDKSIQEAYLGK